MYTVIDVVKRANQRGGRMLSLVDLLIAETLDIEQAAWLVARLEQGSSFLVGANPGGAGKTTIMAALLGMLPDTPAIHLAAGDGRWRNAGAGDCIVAYEINDAAYEAYIWGDDLVALTRLGMRGCRIVSNLHADTLDEARYQIVTQCGADEGGFRAFDLFLPITITRFGARAPRVHEIWQADPRTWRRAQPHIAAETREAQIAAFLDECRKNEVRRVERLRGAWLAWRG